MIIVFLKDKLITCDTILPVLMEIQKYKKHRVYFLVPKKKTMESIKKNIVLFDVISSMGTLDYIESEGKISRKISSLSKLLFLSLKCYAEKGHILYFSEFGKWLELILGMNRGRVIRAESNNFGFSPLEIKAETAAGLTSHTQESNKSFFGDSLLKFSDHFNVSEFNLGNKQLFDFGPTRSRPIWINHIQKKSQQYLSELFAQWTISPVPSIVYILSYFGVLITIENDQTMKRLFKESLKILVQEANGVPILIKPHSITDLKIVEEEIQKYPEARIAITHLHPSILANTASFFVGNLCSTTFGDATFFNVPTVEFTSYKSEALAATGNGSMRPEFVTHFINNNHSLFQKTVRSLLDNSESVPMKKAKTADDNRTFFQIFI